MIKSNTKQIHHRTRMEREISFNIVSQFRIEELFVLFNADFCEIIGLELIINPYRAIGFKIPWEMVLMK